MPWPRPATQTVVLFGRKSVLGPLRVASWSAAERKLYFTALSARDGEVLRTPVEEFFRIARVERFTVTLNEYDPSSRTQSVVLLLSRLSWLDLEELRKVSEVLDGSTDVQIVNWAARYLHLPRLQTGDLKLLLGSLPNDDSLPTDEVAQRKRQRLQQLTAETSRVLELGEEVARALAETPAFGELVGRHAGTLVAQQVDNAMKLRAHEIELAMQPRLRALDELKAALDSLSAEYEKKAAV